MLTHSPKLTGSINLFTDKERYRISVLPDGFFIVCIISIGIILSSTNQVEQNLNLSGASAVCSLSPFLQPYSRTRKKVANSVKFLKVAYFLEIGLS